MRHLTRRALQSSSFEESNAELIDVFEPAFVTQMSLAWTVGPAIFQKDQIP